MVQVVQYLFCKQEPWVQTPIPPEIKQNKRQRGKYGLKKKKKKVKWDNLGISAHPKSESVLANLCGQSQETGFLG
jgi:hypothetical protein